MLVDFFTSPGFSTERLRIFLARGLTRGPGDRTGVRSTRRGGAPARGLGAAGQRHWPGFWPVSCTTAWLHWVSCPRMPPARRVHRAAVRGCPGALTGGRELGSEGIARQRGRAALRQEGLVSHEGWRPQGGQEPRVPGRDHAVRRARAGPGRARGLRRAGRGTGSAIPDADFVAAGAQILPTADDVWQTGDLILKVKEPIAEEYHRMRKGQVLFTYLHLAASRPCTDALLESGHHRRSPTRPSSCRTGRCRCWHRCRRWPGGWPPRSGLITCSATAAAAAC